MANAIGARASSHPSTCTGAAVSSEQQRAEWSLWTLKFTTCSHFSFLFFFFATPGADSRSEHASALWTRTLATTPSPTLISTVLSHPSPCLLSHSAPRIAGVSHARAAVVTRQEPAEQAGAALSSRHEKASTPGTHPSRAIAIRSPIPCRPPMRTLILLPESIRQSRTWSYRGRMPDAPLPRV